MLPQELYNSDYVLSGSLFLRCTVSGGFNCRLNGLERLPYPNAPLLQRLFCPFELALESIHYYSTIREQQLQTLCSSRYVGYHAERMAGRSRSARRATSFVALLLEKMKGLSITGALSSSITK